MYSSILKFIEYLLCFGLHDKYFMYILLFNPMYLIENVIFRNYKWVQ